MAKTTRKRTTRKTTNTASTRRRAKKKALKAYEVGEAVKIEDTDAEAIRMAEADIARIDRMMGQLRRDTIFREAELSAASGQAQKALRELVMAAGTKVDIPTGPESEQKWNFSIDQMQFTRQA